MKPLDDVIHEILDDNKDLVDLNQELADLKPKRCVKCNDICEGEEGKDYLTMVGITYDENMGRQEHYCSKHMHSNIMPS